ncbi:MAG: hypothetical protein EPN47_16015 [Acidobacteria bacterium]|nr:MAG: hypothetical protein EPN47_16015 [Acidobacteriota bacterium]
MGNVDEWAISDENDDGTRKRFEEARWPEGTICPHCGQRETAIRLEPRPESERPVRPGVWQCNHCRRQFTVTTGTIFEGSHLPLQKWLMAIHLMASSREGISAYRLRRELGLGSYRTALSIVRRIRWALGQEPLKSEIPWQRRRVKLPWLRPDPDLNQE